jgi:hypothetical protein
VNFENRIAFEKTQPIVNSTFLLCGKEKDKEFADFEKIGSKPDIKTGRTKL